MFASLSLSFSLSLSLSLSEYIYIYIYIYMYVNNDVLSLFIYIYIYIYIYVYIYTEGYLFTLHFLREECNDKKPRFLNIINIINRNTVCSQNEKLSSNILVFNSLESLFVFFLFELIFIFHMHTFAYIKNKSGTVTSTFK